MRFSLISLLALAIAAPSAFAQPAPAAPEPTVYTKPLIGRTLEKRAVPGRVEVDGLRYRTCPRTSCTAVGQYAIYTPINIVCYTRDNTTPVNGDYGWGKLTNGYWVALAWQEYVSWTAPIPYC
ncbi:hypothetical protein B0H34DRAFT_692535 [Crassisporium funariophilum]|nr:hypothetical protein B0H34DRAFT_692535 [Crassisporium funariophilum]